MRTPPFFASLCLAIALALTGEAGAGTLQITSRPQYDYPVADTSGITLSITNGANITIVGGNTGTGGGAGNLTTNAIGVLQVNATYNATLGEGASTNTVTLTDPIVLWDNAYALTSKVAPIPAGTRNYAIQIKQSKPLAAAPIPDFGTLTRSGSGTLVLGQTTTLTSPGALINPTATLNVAAANYTLSGAAVHALSPSGNNALTIQKSRDLGNTMVLAAQNSEPSPVPEPSTGVLALAGLAMILGRRSRR